MDNQLKQRLVGAAVLASLAVIFLPSLFQRDDRSAIDTTSQIPPAPVVEPVVIAPPVKPDTSKLPPPQALFQPEVSENQQDNASEVDKATENPPAVASKEAPTRDVSTPEKPHLTESGVPAGWVVQVASFKAADSAAGLKDKLLKQSLRAYIKPVTTTKGEFHRVFVGPFIDKQTAVDTQQQVNKAYKLESRVLRYNPVSGD